MIPKEALKNIRRIEITTRRLVNEALAGHYHSVFKGIGMEFDEVRGYQVGDDIRTIDWNVTARTGEPFIKKFVEERELTVIICLDISHSTHFSTRGRLKSELAAELCSLLAFSAIKNNDRVGLLTFTDKIERYIPPKKGTRHVLRLIREALYNEPVGRGTDIPMALVYLSKILTSRCVIFVISDFLSDGYKQPLSILNKRHDVSAISITDPVESVLPDIGLIEMLDAETKERVLVDTSSPAVRRFYNEFAGKNASSRRKIFNSINVDHIEITTDVPYVKTLIKFFRMREKRFVP